MVVRVMLLFVVTCLVVPSWATPLLQIGNSLFAGNMDPETILEWAREGDILVVEGQERQMMQRKATRYSNNLWPADNNGIATVPFVIGANIRRTKLLEAIDQWHDNTCIAFEEVSTDFDGPHLIFVDSKGCSSYIGLVKNSGQEVQLHSSCVTSVGPAAHEIGHALGFYHEQSRSDRDDYVDLYYDNVESGREGNFVKYSTNNYGIPYDYYSIMHYGSTFFSSNGQNTIVAKRLIAQTLIGNRDSLSFRDIKLANKVYKCIDSWLEECGLEEEVCLNEGYTGRDCGCVCPPGASGAQCEVLSASYTDALIKIASPHSEEIETTGTVSTPGYPVPIQQLTKFMKVLKAPDCHRVKLTINKLDIYPRSSSGSCSIDSFTVYVSSTINNGTTYCGKEISPGTEFMGDDTIVLEYQNYDYAGLAGYTSRFAGFTGEITHVPLPGCADEGESPLEMEDPTSPPPAVFSTEVDSGDCSFESTDSVNKFVLRSPEYPARYRGQRRCTLTLHSSEPRYLAVTPTEERLGSWDSLTVTAPGGHQRRISRDSTSVLSANAKISVRSGWIFRNNAFSVEFEAVKSDCHRIIELDEQETGSLVLPSTYSAQTYCEWWIKGPEGKKVRLEMTEPFSVGTKTNNFCPGDKLMVDRDGDSRYASATEYCGQNAATSVVSSGTQLNVLFSGLQGGSASVEAFYSVI